MRLTILVSFLLTSTLAVSQNVVIKGTVIDDMDREPIKQVAVLLGSTNQLQVRTDDKGVFIVPHNYQEPDQLLFRHPGFKNTEWAITKRALRRAVDDTVYVTIVMEWHVLEPFSVGIYDTVYGSQKHSIADFEFYGKQLVMLAYDQTLRKESKVLLVDHKQELLDTVMVPDRAKKLYKDYKGEISVLCEHNVYRVLIFGNDIELQAVDPEHYYKYVVPIEDTLAGKIYYSNYNPDYPAFDYYAYNPVDSSHSKICELQDDLIMELYRAEYKYVDGAEKVWAMNKETETGIDKEIWIGLKYFTQSIYYKPLYAPMFIVDDEVLVFDHYHDKLYKYDEDHEVIDSTVIYYHKLKGKQDWKNVVMKDSKRSDIYTVVQMGGYQLLSAIDLETGKLEEGYKLANKYVEEIQVRDGYVYYIYRPFESIQKKYLYKEKLPSRSGTKSSDDNPPAAGGTERKPKVIRTEN